MNVYVFFKEYNWHNEIILNAIQSKFSNALGVVQNDEHILPDSFISLTELVLERIHGQQISSEHVKSLYTYFIEIPEFATIFQDFVNSAVIRRKGKPIGRIECKFPYDKGFAESVQWFFKNQVPIRQDFYNKYGNIFFSKFRLPDGQLISKDYYDNQGKHVLSYDYTTDFYTVLENGCSKNNYNNIKELYRDIHEQVIKEGDAVLFGDYDTYKLCTSIGQDYYKESALLVATKEDADKCLNDDVARNENVICFDDSGLKNAGKDLKSSAFILYQPKIRFHSDKRRMNQILILTDSDQIKDLDVLANALPEFHFHIAARTLVSDYLNSFGDYDNITIYPGISEKKLYDLLHKCSVLLDISFYAEFRYALSLATYYDLLVVGYEETIHNRSYIIEECIFSNEASNKLSKFLIEICDDSDKYDTYISKQRKHMKY